MGNLQVVERFAKALSKEVFDTQDALIHDDFVLTYPQLGERIRGRANRRATIEGYPSRAETGMPTSTGRIIGTNEDFVPRVVGPGWGLCIWPGQAMSFR